MRLRERWEKTFDGLGYPDTVFDYLWSMRPRYGTDEEIEKQINNGHAREVAINMKKDIEGLTAEANRYFRKIN